MNTIRKNFLKVSFLLILGTVAFYGCKINDKSQNEVVNQATQDNASSEGEFDDVSSISNDVLSSVNLGRTEETQEQYECATVTISLDPTKGQTYRRVVIDFGTGCKAFNGRTRKGKMVVELTNRPSVVGSIVTTTFDNFFVNDVKVEGTHTTTNVTTNANSPEYTVSVRDAKLTFPDGTTATWKADRRRTWSAGFSTRSIEDDEFRITGANEGTNRKGVKYVVAITNALVLKPSCWARGIFKPVAGIVTVTTDNNVATIDYGDGACNNTFTVTINGKTYVINRG
ncbi:MAG: hypothetical protein EAZ55_01995 [Cytophagales bacterium]|nr:MAG: hypothetical protein EAZ55_01995 [Cytophagales bacterium]